ncbi:hypothetical protein [Arsenophonus sp.]|uniref:hypothetical protein n=1 Tax=Arsenophonus sp. TaxID=1872640 RepID=UPI00285C6B0E|nr:hypothetical protein [Arsenophonus sp.]MDR5616211.1 hypothetical protein [Arsenophonus sp.]
MSVWDDFGKLELLWINILNYDNDGYNNHKYATIFGNGKNQATIYIRIRISDKNKKILIIPDDELLKAVHLVHYTEGKRLNRQGDNSNYKPWVYTNEDLGYAKVISTSNTVKSEVSTYGEYGQVIKLYLHATEPNEGFKISAGIDIPGVVNFNTSEMGTITRNGPEGKTGSAFKYPHFVHIKAITPIDYGSKYNVLANKGSSEISNKIKISKVGNERQYLKDIFYFNGISKREDISIRPKEIKSNDKNTFKVINVIRDKKANLDTAKFLNNNLPDIIVGMGGGSFSSYFVFVAPQDLFGLMPGSCIYGVEEFTNIVYKYELSQEVTNYGGSDSPNLSSSSPSAAVFILQCNIPLRNVGKFNWCNQNENAVVKMEVIDSYGNSGIITIKSHYGDSSIIDITINEE